MLKIIYESEPFYTDHGLNDTSTKKLEMSFDNDSSVTEILAQILKLLEFMGYSKQSVSSFESIIDDLTWDGYIIDDKNITNIE